MYLSLSGSALLASLAQLSMHRLQQLLRSQQTFISLFELTRQALALLTDPIDLAGRSFLYTSDVVLLLHLSALSENRLCHRWDQQPSTNSMQLSHKDSEPPRRIKRVMIN
ncbi:hypothetical protein HWD96_26270 [Pseudomonas putida]|uniref:hypothetical protein n=1 Tax=Pseudomonas putida TaxID=303 RepID=UPI001F520E79|nr:hypothetical protein [Pseudomonas putida]MCI1025724.1 hypothetical protein [Pseudomonas putida]